MTQTNLIPQQTINSLEFSEVDSSLQPDARRMMRNERFALQAAIDSGDRLQIAAAVKEAQRVAAMWGVTL